MSHPILPAGYNADDNNGDEVDGAGTNWPIWTVLFVTFEGLIPLIVTDEMLEAFDTLCPDIDFPPEEHVYQFPAVLMTEMISDDWGTVLIEGEGVTLVFPQEIRTQAVRSDAKPIAITGESDAMTLPDEADADVIRKAS